MSLTRDISRFLLAHSYWIGRGWTPSVLLWQQGNCHLKAWRFREGNKQQWWYPTVPDSPPPGRGVKIGMEGRTGTHKAAETNPALIPQMHMRPVLKLRLAMGMLVKMIGGPTQMTDSGRLFCFSCHLKGVCTINFSYQNSRRPLSIRANNVEGVYLWVWGAASGGGGCKLACPYENESPQLQDPQRLRGQRGTNKYSPQHLELLGPRRPS